MKLRNIISIEKERKIKPNYLTFCLFKLCTYVGFLIHFVTLEVVPTFWRYGDVTAKFFWLDASRTYGWTDARRYGDVKAKLLLRLWCPMESNTGPVQKISHIKCSLPIQTDSLFIRLERIQNFLQTREPFLNFSRHSRRNRMWRRMVGSGRYLKGMGATTFQDIS